MARIRTKQGLDLASINTNAVQSEQRELVLSCATNCNKQPNFWNLLLEKCGGLLKLHVFASFGGRTMLRAEPLPSNFSHSVEMRLILMLFTCYCTCASFFASVERRRILCCALRWQVLVFKQQIRKHRPTPNIVLQFKFSHRHVETLEAECEGPLNIIQSDQVSR